MLAECRGLCPTLPIITLLSPSATQRLVLVCFTVRVTETQCKSESQTQDHKWRAGSYPTTRSSGGLSLPTSIDFISELAAGVTFLLPCS